ncbi:MAG: hypothetical protein HYU86_09435 [Chloroflexi bacterium]|nr:hypothetical protein [Chloroflexota bacterium]
MSQPWAVKETGFCLQCQKEYPLETKRCPLCGSRLVAKTVRVPLDRQ